VLNSFLTDLLQHSILFTVAELTQLLIAVLVVVSQDPSHLVVKCCNRSTIRACYATIDSTSNHSEQKSCLIVCIYYYTES